MFINIKTKTLKQSYTGRWNNKIHLCPIKEKKSICAKLFDLKRNLLSFTSVFKALSRRLKYSTRKRTN